MRWPAEKGEGQLIQLRQKLHDYKEIRHLPGKCGWQALPAPIPMVGLLSKL